MISSELAIDSLPFISNLCSTDKFSLHSMVWKFRDFSITHFLREIKFGILEVLKIAVFAILGGLNFVNLANYGLQKVQKYDKFKIQSLWMCQNGIF